MMRNPELEPKEYQAEQVESEDEKINRRVAKGNKKEHTDDGYSEKQQALDIEARSGDLYALKKSKGFQNLNSSSRTLAAYQTISGQLGKLIETYTHLVEKDLHQAQKMLAEIKKIRAMQKVLLTKLFGQLEENGDFNKEELEKELKEFLE